MDILNWPKIDLHRHLEGSIRIDTFIELAKTKKLNLPLDNLEEVKKHLTVQPKDARTLTAFLQKFVWLRKIIDSSESLARITYEAVEDAAKDNVIYLELRFNPGRMFQNGMNEKQIIEGITRGVAFAEARYNIHVGLICGVARDMPVEIGHSVVDFAIANRDCGIVGVDLMGDEEIDLVAFAPVFQRAKQARLHVTVHAGEMGGATDILNAIEVLGAERIGHGTHLFGSDLAVKKVRQENVLIECCITSNEQTGAIDMLKNHPIQKMYRNGLPVSINTDDPSISGINLTHEYDVAIRVLGIGVMQLQNIICSTSEYIFRDELKESLKNRLLSHFELLN